MSKVEFSIKRRSGEFHLEGKNSVGNIVLTDGSPDIGGTGLGARPMELLLASLGSCSAIDVILILKKQRQILSDIKIDISAVRVDVDHHSEFETIDLFFHLYGDIKESKAKRAIELSLNEYCSVAKILDKTAKITYQFDINQNEES
jgi:putative redox protein